MRNKVICEKIEKINNNMHDAIYENFELFQKLTGDRMPKYSKLEDTIISQQRTIEQLTNALCNKYEHGLFIFGEDGKIPMVIRNGKELTNNMTTSFSIDWCPGEIPEIHINQLATTHHDMED